MTQDYAQAMSYWQKACDGGIERACENIGQLYWFGKSVSKDPLQAANFYRKGCSGGEMESCAELGWMYETDRA